MAATSEPSRLNASRGLLGAGLWGVIGAAAPVAILSAFMVGRWWLEGASSFDRQLDLRWLKRDLPGPVIGCAAIFASAGWAANAPLGAFRFAKSLAIIFAMTLPLWFFLGSMQLTPRRIKGDNHPVFYPSEFMIVFGPPILAAAMVTVLRMRKAPGGVPAADGGSGFKKGSLSDGDDGR